MFNHKLKRMDNFYAKQNQQGLGFLLPAMGKFFNDQIKNQFLSNH